MTVEIIPTSGAAVTIARPAVLRLQRMIALAVVVLPFLGAVGGIALCWKHGIGTIQLGSLVVMYVLCMLGVTVGLHRYFAHRSFDTSGPMKVLLAILGSMAAQGPVLFWVSTHRRHHAHSDKPGDPHSPNLHGGGLSGMLRGLWHAHIAWMFSNELTDFVHYSRDVLRDRTVFQIHRLYPLWVLLGLALPAAVCGMITGTWYGALQGFLWGGLVRIFLVNHSSWCVGSVCHMIGSKPFATHDKSANNYVVAVLTFGEGLQNNHHAFPSSHAHAVRWWQPDLSAWVIRTLRMAGLVWNVKYPSEQVIRDARVSRNTTCDDDRPTSELLTRESNVKSR